MAKKNKKRKNSDVANEEVKESTLLTILITILIIIIWLAVFVIFVKLDIGRFGSSVLAPVIKDVPVLNMILPGELGTQKDKSKTDNEINDILNLEYGSLEEAIARIKELEKENKRLKKNNKGGDVEELQKEIDRLKFFEENQLAFEEIKLKFDKEVVFTNNAPSIEEYQAYYELIDPVNAELIYRQVVEQIQYNEGIKEKAEIYGRMEPAAAARILEVMTADTDSIAKILLNMKPKASAAILGEMDNVFAARITKKMIDLDEEKLSN